ncbi:hypothetical protein [Streptomyces sp. NPDC047718]|uniref:hypothetical protein n=1 Tax=Streptomyces sp. NPDC047718 TaxID=3155479 RepID=UPI00340BF1EE
MSHFAETGQARSMTVNLTPEHADGTAPPGPARMSRFTRLMADATSRVAGKAGTNSRSRGRSAAFARSAAQPKARAQSFARGHTAVLLTAAGLLGLGVRSVVHRRSRHLGSC